MFSQKEAVFNAILSVFSASGREINGKVALSNEEKKSVVAIVVAGIDAGEVVFSNEARTKYTDTKAVSGYVGGMVGNWLTKDTRLNGGEKYQAKNPGSRVGQGDEVLKNLKALRSQLSETEHLNAVDEKIKERNDQIAASKAKKVEVDFSTIPADLLERLGINQ